MLEIRYLTRGSVTIKLKKYVKAAKFKKVKDNRSGTRVRGNTVLGNLPRRIRIRDNGTRSIIRQVGHVIIQVRMHMQRSRTWASC